MINNPLKTFTSIHLNDYKILNDAIVGFEFEFYSNMSYAKLMELMNLELKPIKVWGFNEYHSEFEPDNLNYKIEPDYSGGPDMVELITGPLEYNESIITLIKILNFIKKYGKTDEKCSIHINISFKNKEVKNTTKLALLLDIDENYLYDMFPSRKGNIYAKSVKNLLPFKQWDSPNAGALLIESGLDLPDDTKYYGVNIASIDRGWIEYRYLGGKEYELKQASIMESLDYLILLTNQNINSALNDEHKLKIRAYLGERINLYSKFKNLDTLQANFPDIDVQIDMSNDIQVIESLYPRIYDKIYDAIGTSRIGPATVNYDTERTKLEVINTRLVAGAALYNIDLINCTLEDTRIVNCSLINCKVFKSHIEKCEVIDTEAKSSRANDCIVKTDSKLIDCYVTACKVDDATIDGGVFKPGSISRNTVITNNTLKPTATNFWGNTTGMKKPKITK